MDWASACTSGRSSRASIRSSSPTSSRPGWCSRWKRSARRRTASRQRGSRKKSYSPPKARGSFRSTLHRSFRLPTHTESLSIGWIGTGRMGFEMAARLAKGGADVLVWNRTRAKAEPLVKYGARIADDVAELADRDIVFCMVSTWEDVKAVMTSLLGNAPKRPRVVVECSSISLEGSAELRRMLDERRIDYLATPVSGNAKVVKAGRLSFVCSGPKAAFDAARPCLEMIGPSASYVGEGEV